MHEIKVFCLRSHLYPHADALGMSAWISSFSWWGLPLSEALNIPLLPTLSSINSIKIPLCFMTLPYVLYAEYFPITFLLLTSLWTTDAQLSKTYLLR